LIVESLKVPVSSERAAFLQRWTREVGLVILLEECLG